MLYQGLRLGSGAHGSVRTTLRRLSIIGLFTALGACGGGGDGNGLLPGGGGGGGGWTPGLFLPATTFQAQCASPRSGNDPNGNPWPDRQGTRTDENNFLRSYSDDTYLWYADITDRDPALFDTPTYFDGLRTFDTTPSGTPTDNFHFSIGTDEWIAQSQGGVSGGYGAQFAVLEPSPPRLIVVAFTNPGTPATSSPAFLARGAEIVSINGVDVANGNDVDTLNAGLFPEPGETFTFEVRDLGASGTRTFSMTAGNFASTPVQNVSTIPTAPEVGYLLFNDHIATAEQQLVDAVNQLAAQNITDLIVDLRYNGGGFLDIASEFAYMIGGMNTSGLVFEEQQFNDKYPSTNPVTGQPLTPLLFHDQAPGFFTIAAGTPLPTLNLPRVYVLTGSGTCSASEAIMNGLRGAGVEVIQIGSRTCGKPYGFYPTDNCGTTYFTIQFRGVNAANFGDYADGFRPANSISNVGESVPGCNVGDDFTAALGDVNEARLAAALAYRQTGACPAPSAITTPGVSKLTLTAEETILLPRSQWRQNRIMQR